MIHELDLSNAAARYEATVSTGLEKVAQEEITQKLRAKTEISKGRVILESDKPVSEILKLKTINNLFIIIYDQIIEDSSMPQDTSQLESLLMKVGDSCNLRLGLSKWHQLSRFDRCKFDDLFLKAIELRDIQPSFRVSSNRHGKDHKFTSPEICSIFGHVIDTKYGWPIKMKNFDLELYVNFSENHLYATITLTPVTLACRNIITTGYTTLKGATCYALLRFANIESGDLVLDPMAGSGAIPVENIVAWNDEEWRSFTLCSDLTHSIISKSKINMRAVSKIKNPPSDVMRSDVTYCPIRDGTIDVVVTDLPFGHRHGSKTANRSLYPKMMLELSRITRPVTGRAVLLTKDFRSMNLAYDATKHYWTQTLCNHVKIGNLNCWIYRYQRNSEVYNH